MKFRRVALAGALGHVLGHNVAHGGRRVLSKGRVLGEREIEALAAIGVGSTYVAELEPGDVPEDAAALRIGGILGQCGGFGVEPANGGRVSLRAPALGVLSLSESALLELNLLAGVTLAARPKHSVLAAGQIAATLKIIPFALPEAIVERAEQLGRSRPLGFAALVPRRVHVLIGGAEDRRERLLASYREPLERRLSALGQSGVETRFVVLGAEPEQALAAALAKSLDAGAQLVIVAGETATMDADDVAPRAIRRAGGDVAAVGAPVFPGNLLLLGYRAGTAVLGAPGCVRSPERNIVDLLLPRLLAGERVGQREIAELGALGMLSGAAVEGGREEA